MRTTITLDDDVERMLQDEMHRSRLSFKACVNQVLRAGFAAATSPAPEPYVVRSQNMGLRPGFDPDRLNHLADDLEDEELIARMRAYEDRERLRLGHR